MLVSGKRFKEILQKHGEKIEQPGKYPLVYHYQGKWGCSSYKMMPDVFPTGFPCRLFHFHLELPNRPIVDVERVVCYRTYIPKTPGQLDIDSRPGYIYNTKEGQSILEDRDLNDFYLVFCCLQEGADAYNSGNSDWLIFYNCELVHTFKGIIKLCEDKHNFFLDGCNFLRSGESKNIEVWQLNNGVEALVDTAKMSLGLWCDIYGYSLTREYSIDNEFSAWSDEITVESNLEVIWECKFNHTWKAPVKQRTEKILKHELDSCPICRRKRREYAELSRQKNVRYKKNYCPRLLRFQKALNLGDFGAARIRCLRK